MDGFKLRPFRLTALALALLCLPQSILTQKKIMVPPAQKMTPENTLFVFDLHGVVLKFDLNKVRFNSSIHFLGGVFNYFFKNSGEQNIEGAVLNAAPNSKTYLDNALATINPHIPNLETIEIIKQLKTSGYQIFGCSNIGKESLAYLNERYPNAFKDFSAFRTSNPNNNYGKKNKPEAYLETLQIIEDALGTDSFSKIQYIIFVDDTKKNLLVAEKADARFQGILFKSPTKFKKTLTLLKIL